MTTHDTWEQIHHAHEWGQYPAEHIIRFVARNYYNSDRKTIKILDFGCGGGAHTWYLAREGFDTYAFDISESAVARVEKRLEREGLTAHLTAMDGTKMNYQEDFFDAVIDSASILHNPMKDIKTMYRNTYRVLKSGGKLITVIFSTETVGYGTGTMIEPNTYEGIEIGALQGRGCVHFFEKQELEDTLAKAGFREVVVDSILYTDQGNVVSQYVAIGKK